MASGRRLFICDGCDLMIWEDVPGELGSWTSHLDCSGEVIWAEGGIMRPEQWQKRLL